MSLINDALRRASQTERNRPHRAATPMGMEPAPTARSSSLSVLLAAAGLVALLLAGWLFWQLWNARNNPGSAVVLANIAAPVTPHVIPPSVVAAKPAPVTPAAPANPAPAPVVVSAPPVVIPPVAAPPMAASPVAVTPVVAPPIAPPAAAPSVARDNPVAWPVNMTLSAIFFSKTNPRVLINGNLYGVGDEIQGVVLKKIEKDEVTVEWNGHSKVLMLGGQ
jgi:hypothetical protein